MLKVTKRSSVSPALDQNAGIQSIGEQVKSSTLLVGIIPKKATAWFHDKSCMNSFGRFR